MMDFKNAKELLHLCEEAGSSISDIMLKREIELGEISEACPDLLLLPPEPEEKGQDRSSSQRDFQNTDTADEPYSLPLPFRKHENWLDSVLNSFS